jgi:cystathionine gamma-synthase
MDPSIWDTLYTEVAVGAPVPPYTPHAVSVSLPKWRDVVGYEEGEKRVVDCMLNGYPRFFIHLTISKVLQSFCPVFF